MFKPKTLGKRKNTNSKKANQNKLRAIENAKRILDDITICNIYVPKDNSAEKGWDNSCVFSKDKPIKVSQSLAWHLDNIRVKWEVTCGVFCRTQQGKHYMEYFTFEASKECYSFDVSDQAQQVCYWLFMNAIKMEKLCPFWLAVPRTTDKDIDLTLALKTAHKNQVFNRIGTNFELNCNLPYVDYHTEGWFDIPMDWDKVRHIDVDLEEALSIQLQYKENLDGTTELQEPTEP